MALIKGFGNHSQVKHSLMKAMNNGVPCEKNLTTGQKNEQKKNKSDGAEITYENFNWPRRRID
jgi:hypothetical protein